MKKLVVLVFVALFAVLGCTKKEGADGAAGTAAGETYKLRMSSIYADPGVGDITYKSLGAAMQKFIKDVDEKTGGRVQIQGFYASVLGSANDTFQQMERGEIDIYYGQPMSAIDTRFGAWSIPYLFRDYDEIRTHVANPDSEFFKLSASWMSEHGAVLLAMGLSNTRGMFNTKHRVTDVQSVSDLKLRTYEDPVVSAFWEDICQAMPMPVSEVYTAMQTNSIDGLEFPPTSVIGRKYQEVGKFYSDINWQWANGAAFVINTDSFNKLPDDLKQIVTDCAREAAVFQGEREIADEAVSFDTLKAAGVEIYNLTPEERQSWVDYSNSIAEKIRTAVGAEAYDAVINIVQADRTAEPVAAEATEAAE
ncbi:MAG: TRAP transporter substrate-binding protein [Deferribacteraceae bacterium]|nr:TRAP transporter substrate-binding protein [Deferribacteraceae bacterium]